MTRRWRLAIAAAGSAAALAIGLLLYCQWAIRQVQPYYSSAIQVDPSTLKNAGLELESRVTSLVSDAVENDNWQAVFSNAEVNGWLATTLPEKFADLLPETVSDLRVAFSEGTAAFGFRYQDTDFTSVITLRVSVVSADNGAIAVRLLEVRAGTLPIPLARIIASITEEARRQQVALRWTQQEGDPVALIPVSGMLSTPEVERRLDVIEFHEGELYVAGSTLDRPAKVAEKEEAILER